MAGKKADDTGDGQAKQTGADVTAQFLPLTDARLAELTDDGSLKRGRDYFRSGQVFDAFLRGDTLRARCEGTDPTPYRVEATLARAGGGSPVVRAKCSCPRGGFCKHVVALLLLWMRRPEDIALRPEVGELLEGRERNDLIRIIARMVDRHPELEPLLELPPVGAGGARSAPTVDPKSIARQVKSAFRNVDRYEWGAGGEIADEIERLRGLADDYAGAGSPADAVVVYATLLNEAADGWEELEDEEGALSGELKVCAEALTRLIESEAGAGLDAPTRALAFEGLYTAWESGPGEAGHGVPETLSRLADAHERALLMSWLRRDMEAGSEASRYGNRRRLEWLLGLKREAGADDGDMLEEYERAGLYDEMVAFLIQKGRVDEALPTAEKRLNAPGQWTQAGDELLKAGGENVDRAFGLIARRLAEAEKRKDEQAVESYLYWQSERYFARGRLPEALATARRRFDAGAARPSYDAARRAALALDPSRARWDALRPELLARFAESEHMWPVVAGIHLEEGEVRLALDALPPPKPRKPNTYGGWGGGASANHEARLKVAAAAEKEFPDEAGEIYLAAAEDLVNARGRENYQQSARLLVKARELYAVQGLKTAWADTIARFRLEYKGLPAFKEELNRAGL